MAAYLKRFYIANASYTMSTTFIKLSLLFQYLSIFDRQSRERQFTIFMAVVIALWGIAFSFMAWFPCFPVSGYWSFLTESATCYGFGSKYAAGFTMIYECHAGLNMAFDVIVLVIPIPLYFEKSATPRVRMGLIGMFLLGTIINVFGVWRLATIVIHRATTYPTFDPTWYSPISLIQACLEVDAASICASIPIFWPVLVARFDEIFVTREITITQEHRRLSELGEGNDIELWRSRSTRGGKQESTYSGGESEAPLDDTKKQGNTSNYVDRYVIDQIDPLREDKKGGVESSVTVGPLDAVLQRPTRPMYLNRL
ncbi:hypothetical protein BP5796_09809 [Coleophoma crateriformis]|uniref:Rhodopsin domain-containing protein n=1 Tax=Coleophoma crateriformis TaxID=565419 RepID=A0A3D8QZG8_9HELO|nr:hypothetical protein BP5796_09809 [Coleophoma crateriformis]